MASELAYQEVDVAELELGAGAKRRRLARPEHAASDRGAVGRAEVLNLERIAR
jgi:hypothetical protein